MKKNALIGQLGGPTSVINASLCGLIQEGLKSKKIKHILGMRNGIVGLLKEEIVDLGKEDKSVIRKLNQIPSSILGSSRYALKKKDFTLILEIFKKFDIGYLFLIGGNGTMQLNMQIEQYCKKNNYSISIIGIPNTVDNDLCETDHSPGFASAAKYICLSVQQAGQLARDMKSIDKYVIFQTIGRNTGWLAASSAFAKKRDSDAPHLIYMPERPLSKEKVLSDVRECIEKYGWVSIVCGEGILWEDKRLVANINFNNGGNSFEYGAVGGGSAALNLHKLIYKETNYRGEFQITESLSMCAIDRVSSVDLKEAYFCGIEAIKLAEEGISGVMVSLYRTGHSPYCIEFRGVTFENIVCKVKSLDDKYINKQGNYVTDKFITYIEPLIGKLPEYSKLNYIKYL